VKHGCWYYYLESDCTRIREKRKELAQPDPHWQTAEEAKRPLSVLWYWNKHGITPLADQNGRKPKLKKKPAYRRSESGRWQRVTTWDGKQLRDVQQIENVAPDPNLLPVKQAAARRGVGESTLRRAAKEDRIEHEYVGGRLRVKPRDPRKARGFKAATERLFEQGGITWFLNADSEALIGIPRVNLDMWGWDKKVCHWLAPGENYHTFEGYDGHRRMPLRYSDLNQVLLIERRRALARKKGWLGRSAIPERIRQEVFAELPPPKAKPAAPPTSNGERTRQRAGRKWEWQKLAEIAVVHIPNWLDGVRVTREQIERVFRDYEAFAHQPTGSGFNWPPTPRRADQREVLKRARREAKKRGELATP